ncbi:MAG: phosphotransferase [Thalassotalea sp.]|nr:phosphotransferase [Thalassotalea sp.]
MDAIAALQAIKFLQPISDVEPIESGLSHHCFKVTAHSNSYFVKVYKTATNASFTEQIKIEQLTGEQGLSPKVIDYCRLGSYCVYQYVAGETLLESDASNSDKNTMLIDLLVTCHAIQHKPIPLDIKQSIKSLIQRIKLAHSTKSKIIDKVSTCLQALALNKDELVLCHGDLNYSNVLIADNKPILVDWEYGCLAEKEYDIAMMLAINNVPAERYSAIIDEYNLKAQSTPAKLSKVIQYLSLCELLNTLWFMQSNNISKITDANIAQALKPFV